MLTKVNMLHIMATETQNVIRESEVIEMKAKVVKLIRTETPEGKGTEKDPVRTVVRYWDKKGKLVFKKDPTKNREEI